MNLYIRLIIFLIGSIFKKPMNSVYDTSTLRFYVLPNDLDLNMHMNNGRYPTIMDLGRLDLTMRMGLLRLMLKQKSVPVLSSIKMRFRIPLHLWQGYTLQTRVLCWDDRWVYMEQRFIINKGDKAGAVAAIGLVKGSFYSRKTRTTVPTQELLKAININDQSPPMPAHIQKWQSAEDELQRLTAKDRN